MDASKNAEEPIIKSDKEEDREPSVHTDTFSERKRKSSAASSDVSTTPKTRKKVKTAKNKSIESNTGLTNGAISSFVSKMSLGTAMFLISLRTIHIGKMV